MVPGSRGRSSWFFFLHTRLFTSAVSEGQCTGRRLGPCASARARISSSSGAAVNAGPGRAWTTRLLHGDGEHAPPATGPRCSRRGPHAWWGSVRAQGDQARVGGVLAPCGHPQDSPIRRRRTRVGRAVAVQRRNEGRIAAKGSAQRRGPVNDEVQASAVLGCYPWRGGVD